MRLVTVGLGHRFPPRPDLFTGVDMDLQAGHTCAVTGPSGCGKSTLLGILAGWINPARGHVQRTRVDRVHWVFQNPHGVPARTALDHVTLPLLAQGNTRAAAAKEALGLLERVDLATVSARPFRHLSGGEAQRLMLARALAARPDLLLVDEPTAQLDPVAAQAVIDVLGRLSTTGCIIVIATHDPKVASACSQTISMARP